MVLLLLCCLLLFVQGWRRLTTLAFAAMGLVLIGFSQSSTSIVMTLGLCVLAPVLLTRGAPAPLRPFSYLAGDAGAGIAVCAMAVFQLAPVEIALAAIATERSKESRVGQH